MNRFMSLLTVLVLASATLQVACGGCNDNGNGPGSGLVLADEVAIEVDPSVVNFGAVIIGDVVEQKVRVKHIGTSGQLRLEFTLQSDSEDFSMAPPLLNTLSAGQSIDITLTYAPSDAVQDTGTLVIGTNIAAEAGGTQTVEVPLLTLAQVASLVPTPGTLDFGSVPTGDMLEREVELRNLGGFELTLTAASLQTTATSDFSVGAPEGGLPLVLAPNDSVALPVSYTPTGFNADDEVLEVAFDGLTGSDSATVLLKGVEITARLEATPNPVNFELQLPGVPATKNVGLTNLGSHDLEITSIAVVGEGPYANTVKLLSAPAMPATIIAGTSLAEGVSLEFTAVDEMEPTTEPLVHLELRSNDPENDGVMLVPVFGKRRGLGLEVYPPDILYFGYVNQGGAVSRDVVMYNAANGPLQINSVVIEGGYSIVNPEQWGFTAAGGLTGYTMEPGESISVPVLFENEPGDWPPGMTAWGKFIIDSNDPQNSLWEVLLNARTGDLEPCALQMVPDVLDMGFVAAETTAYGAFDLVNVGQNACIWMGSAIDDCAESFDCELPETDTPPTASTSATFVVGGEPDAGTVLEPGDTFPMLIRFDAPAVESNKVFDFNARLTGWAQFDDPISGEPVFTRLHGPSWGMGANVKARVSLGQLLVQPGTLDYAVTPVGCRSETLVATAQNIGAGPIRITHFELSGCGLEFQLEDFPPLDEQQDDGSFVRTLLPGETVEFGVSYAPQDDSSDTCQLLVYHDTSEEPEVVQLVAAGTYEADQTDYFYDSEAQKVDVLFIVDDSGSMNQEQENLAASFQAFIEEAAKWQSDYQIGVTTTTVQFPVGGDLRGSPSFVSEQNWEKFVPNVLVGTTGSGEEQGLWAAKIALSAPLTDVTEETCQTDNDCSNLFHNCIGGICGGKNMHFLREDAALELIFVSDEDDQSPESLDAYLNFFTSIKGVDQPDQFHVHSIVGPYGGCNSSNGQAWAGHRYLSLAEDTGGVHFSICELDFAKGLEDIGEIAFASKMRYTLSNYPAPTTIEVSINNVPCPLTSAGLFNWKYDNVSNTVTLLEGGICRAAPGDEVKIYYELLCYDTP